MADKPKVAIYWMTACGGCDEAIVDLNEVILTVADAVDIVLWPVALDFKYESIRKMEKGEIALSILNGSIRNSEQEEMAKVLREKSQIVLAFGACACFGGTPGMANFRSKEDIFDWVYKDAPTVVNPNNNRPQPEITVNGNTLTLPRFYERVYPVDDIIAVDYYLPGCPPPPDLIANAIFAVLEDKLPPRGATLAPGKPLCDMCPRNTSKPTRLEISEFKRVHEIEADDDLCFLAQGILCFGPATRSGCGETCIRVNTPCRGCFGPVDGVDDGGAKFISSLASLISAESEDDARRAIDGIPDLAGYCYRFTLPSSSLKRTT
ncbi:MAG TPA: oxidoreductase [Deltaproteobacteria bacterium]|nr:oxidoreductase [Deltaproteobacteria bacterium]HPQ43024.1 F420-nonreducing hydrogenase [Syntrophales bacterium]